MKMWLDEWKEWIKKGFALSPNKYFPRLNDQLAISALLKTRIVESIIRIESS